MKTEKVISLISHAREKANLWILGELEKEGVDGLAPSHGEILIRIFKEGELNMRDIAERIGRKKNTVTVLVDKLVDNGFVKKTTDKADRRVSFISLTEKGESLRPVFGRISSRLIKTAYTGFSAAEKGALIESLERIIDNFNNKKK